MLISVVTPTYQRYDLLFDRCIPSVQAQDYPLVQHCIVHDGSPEEGAGPISQRLEQLPFAALRQSGYQFDFDYIEQHGPGGRTRSRLRGIEMAEGDLVAYLDDDDAYRPEHLSVLAAALETHPDAGFAYSMMASHGGDGAVVAVIGSDPPAFCQIGTPMILHHKAILEYGTWGPDRPDEDWKLIESWMNAGISWVFVPQVTVDVWPSAYRGGG